MVEENDFSAEVTESSKAIQEADKALGGPISLLLGPTFKLIGEHWGKKTERWLNPTQVDNVKNKIEKAAGIEDFEIGSNASPRQIGALIEWTHLVSDVDDVEQPLLSRAWAHTLVDISKNQFELLDALSKLDERDIALIVTGGKLSREDEQKLADCGVLLRRYEIVPRIRVLNMIYAVAQFSFMVFFLAVMMLLASWSEGASVTFVVAWSVSAAVSAVLLSIFSLAKDGWDRWARRLKLFRKWSTVRVHFALSPFGESIRRRLTQSELPEFRSKSP